MVESGRLIQVGRGNERASLDFVLAFAGGTTLGKQVRCLLAGHSNPSRDPRIDGKVRYIYIFFPVEFHSSLTYYIGLVSQGKVSYYVVLCFLFSSAIVVSIPEILQLNFRFIILFPPRGAADTTQHVLGNAPHPARQYTHSYPIHKHDRVSKSPISLSLAMQLNQSSVPLCQEDGSVPK